MYTAKTIWLFGYYVIAMGLVLIFLPHLLLEIAGLPPIASEHQFIYPVVGLIAAVVGLYYVYCGKHSQTAFFKISVVGRILFFVGTILIVLYNGCSPKLMLIGVSDLLGAAWTYWALKKDKKI